MDTIKHTSKPLVYVVEDSKPYRIFLTRVLETQGFNVKVFGNAQNVLPFLRVHVPDLILSDIEMPAMNGFDLYYSIKENFPSLNIPFIYISSTTSEEYIAKASRIGTGEMLTKPLNKHLIKKAVDDIIRSRSLYEPGTPA